VISTVTQASDLLLKSITQLVKDPYSTYSRSRLLESVKGILKGTTDILSVFDDLEIRKIVATATRTRQNLSKLESIDTVLIAANLKEKKSKTPPSQDPIHDPSTVEHFLHVVSLCAQCVFHLAQQATQRTQEVLNPTVQKRLTCLVDTLVKESPMLISACKVALQNPELGEAKVVRKGSCQRLLGTCREIEILVQYCSDEQVLAGLEVSLLVS
jgi:hypothetical protein